MLLTDIKEMQRSNQPDVKSLHIREANDSDIASLNRAFPKSVSTIHTERVALQQKGEAIYLLALQHQKIVGYAFLKWHGSDENHIRATVKNCVDIEDLFVEKVYRGRGIGSKLLNVCIEASRKKGFHKIGLSLEVRNICAKPFYHKHGFLDSGIGEYTLERRVLDLTSSLVQNESEKYRYIVKHI